MIFGDTFPAMGCTAVVQCDRADLLAVARQRISELERMWSLHEPTSDLSRLGGGEAVVISNDTRLLLRFMLAGWQHTNGAFAPITRNTDAAGPGDGEILSDLLETGTASRLPGGIGVDPTAIGKGLAADIVAAELLSAGASQICVSIGGDLAFHGRARPIPVIGPDDREPVAVLSLRAGGVATSSLVSPRTGREHVTDRRAGTAVHGTLGQVTVVASNAAWAEILATACLVDGTLDPVERQGIGALAFDNTGAQLRSTSWMEVVDGDVIHEPATPGGPRR